MNKQSPDSNDNTQNRPPWLAAVPFVMVLWVFGKLVGTGGREQHAEEPRQLERSAEEMTKTPVFECRAECSMLFSSPVSGQMPSERAVELCVAPCKQFKESVPHLDFRSNYKKCSVLCMIEDGAARRSTDGGARDAGQEDGGAGLERILACQNRCLQSVAKTGEIGVGE